MYFLLSRFIVQQSSRLTGGRKTLEIIPHNLSFQKVEPGGGGVGGVSIYSPHKELPTG